MLIKYRLFFKMNQEKDLKTLQGFPKKVSFGPRCKTPWITYLTYIRKIPSPSMFSSITNLYFLTVFVATLYLLSNGPQPSRQSLIMCPGRFTLVPSSRTKMTRCLNVLMAFNVFPVQVRNGEPKGRVHLIILCHLRTSLLTKSLLDHLTLKLKWTIKWTLPLVRCVLTENVWLLLHSRPTVD